MQPGGHRFETGILHQPSLAVAFAQGELRLGGRVSIAKAKAARLASQRAEMRRQFAEATKSRRWTTVKFLSPRGAGMAAGVDASKFAVTTVAAIVDREVDVVLSQLNILQTVVFSVSTKHTQCF